MSTTDKALSDDDHDGLAVRIRNGDRIAFLHVYESTLPRLVRYAYQLTGSRDAAEDAVHSVFLKMWINRSSWNVSGDIDPYLYRSVRNHIINTVKHEKTHLRTEYNEIEDEASGVGPVDNSIENKLEDGDTIALVAAAIRRLPERQKTAVTLRWYAEMSTASIGSAMGISRQAAEKLLRNAEMKLSELLKEYL